MDTVKVQHIIPISGKDSLATAIVQKARQSELDYSYFYNNVGSELPETLDWINKVENKLNITIERVGSNLEDIIYDQGILPAPKTRYCTRLAKIYPMNDMIGKAHASLYYGLRADEPLRIGFEPVKGQNITAIYPLRELGIGINEVYSLLDQQGLMPPDFFWPEMKRLVSQELGLFGYLVEQLTRVENIRFFAWRSRPNCYFCFYQRLSEWVGLYEFHPELFEHAILIEAEVGAKDYSWRSDGFLTELVARKETIKRKRAREVARLILKRFFSETKAKEVLPFGKIDTELQEETSSIELVSCGLLCGK